jgi:hypothetical protein
VDKITPEIALADLARRVEYLVQSLPDNHHKVANITLSRDRDLDG